MIGSQLCPPFSSSKLENFMLESCRYDAASTFYLKEQSFSSFYPSVLFTEPNPGPRDSVPTTQMAVSPRRHRFTYISVLLR